ncbi:hypothetical protein [Pelagibacterium sp.]|uniref:hypothetical protein n=1 Tax=Pelagibacterium sp. TaxID=1967288 RepID=UPI003BACD022
MTDSREILSLTPEEFDDLVDDATHAVNNLIPDGILRALSNAEHSRLLTELNDALTAVLDPYVPKDL